MKLKRYLHNDIERDLVEKMVFLGGPRQVGKTTLSHTFIGKEAEQSEGYFSWDSRQDRKRLLNEELPPKEKLLVFDEIHKYRHWRNLVKGLYDKNKNSHQFLITGSARLDYYRRGGDSLQGRYHYYRLHPLSLAEIGDESTDGVNALLEYGGFPEPFIKQDKVHWRRWQNERMSRVIYDDLRDLENVQEISLLSLLAEALPERVGSPLSIKSLAEDLEVAHKTVKRWVEILSNLYYCYRIAPYGSPRIRAVKKEQKLYLWDWSLCESDGARFENFVASQLLKYCHYMEDSQGHAMELRYIRDTDKREVDFVVLKNQEPLFAVEAKVNDKEVSPHLYYFKERTPIPKFYQVHNGLAYYERNGVVVMPFAQLVQELGLP